MKTYPNQRMVQPTVSENKGQLIYPVTKEKLQVAIQVLTPTQVLIWLDLLGNKKDQLIAFSPAYYSEFYGFNESTVRAAFDNMKKEGFIVAAKGTTNKFYVLDKSSKHASKYFKEEKVVSPSETIPKFDFSETKSEPKKDSKTPSHGFLEALF